MKFKAIISRVQCFSTGGPWCLLKGSTRPVEWVHDLLLAVLGSTEVQKYRGTVTRYFLSTVNSNDDTLKKCTNFDAVVTFLIVLLHISVLFLNGL